MSNANGGDTPPPDARTWRWRHVILTTHGAWLPGDPRGFRNRHHRVHSGGDYRHPPPQGEHTGLLTYTQKLCPSAITLTPVQRQQVGQAIVTQLQRWHTQPLAIAVSAQHVHALARLPTGDVRQWTLIGYCKRAASHAVRNHHPGTIWARRGHLVAIRNRAHQLQVFHYICKHSQRERAWAWTFRTSPLP